MSDPFRLDGKVALVTGANTGIGQAIAIGLARAGAEVIAAGRSSLDQTLELIAAEGLKGRPFQLALDEPAAAAQTLVDARSARHPRQQRRDHPPGRRGRLQRGRLGRRDRRQPEGGVLPVPGLRARRLRARGGRRDRQHRLAARLPGRHPHAVLHRGQARRRRADQAARQRVGGEGASTSTPSRPATSRPTTPRRCAPTPTATRRSSTASRPGAGARPRTSPAPPSSSPRRPRSTSTAPILPVDGGWLAR